MRVPSITCWRTTSLSCSRFVALMKNLNTACWTVFRHEALTNKPFLIMFCYVGGWGAGGKVEVFSRDSAHPSRCPPTGLGHEDCHPAGSGWALQRRRCSHFIPEEPWRGETWDILNITHLLVKTHSDCGVSVFLVEKRSRFRNILWTRHLLKCNGLFSK